MEGHDSCQGLCMCVHAVHMNKNLAFLEKESIFFTPIAAFHPCCLLPELSIHRMKC